MRMRAPRQSERAASFVECILTLPLIFGLLFGTLSVGFAIYTHQKNALVAREIANIVLRRCFNASSESLMSQCIIPKLEQMMQAAPALIGPNPRITLRYGRCSVHQCFTCDSPPCSYDGFSWFDGNGTELSTLSECSYTSAGCACSCGDTPESPSLTISDLVMGGMIFDQSGMHPPEDAGQLYEDIWASNGTPTEKVMQAKTRFYVGDENNRGNYDIMKDRGFAIEVEVATDFIQPRPWDFGVLRSYEKVVF